MRKLSLLFCVLMVILGGMSIFAQDEMDMTPTVEVSDQVLTNKALYIDYVYSTTPAFVVIHQDNEGRPGPVIGYRSVNAGHNYDVEVWVDVQSVTSTLQAMLHVDDCAVGVYEFGSVQGCDAPVMTDAGMVSPAFNVIVMAVPPQLIMGDSILLENAVVSQDSFVVIHADNDGAPGPVLGYVAVSASATNIGLGIALDPTGITPVLHPMLHVDDCAVGVYEFGSVQGCDAPVRFNDEIVMYPLFTGPDMWVDSQVVIYADNTPNMEMMDIAPSVYAHYAVVESAGFLVIHTDNDGAPGPVAGVAPLNMGTNIDVVVTLDMAEPTTVLHPMLHVDDCEIGVYEFGSVQGCDAPVRIGDQIVMYPILAAPAIEVAGTEYAEDEDGAYIYIPEVVIDAHGFLVIHSDNNGAPGPVVGVSPIITGTSYRVYVALDEGVTMSDDLQLFPMLHYDTCELGVYEFGTVDGCDGPVVVGGKVVVLPLTGDDVDMYDMSDMDM